MYDNLVFFNHYGAGDIFESREFVKAICNKIHVKEGYYYAHGKDPSILADLPQLQYLEVDSLMEMRRDIYEVRKDLYINTWIGRDGQYVLPGVGCTVGETFRMFNNMMDKLGASKLPGELRDYYPEIDYSFYKIDEIDKFVNMNDSTKVLICNGPVQSNQAENFNFDSSIEILTRLFPHMQFILTQQSEVDADNIYYTTPLIGKDSFDLNEISYLSKFCSVIVGRKSGPFVFCGTKENWNDPNKTFISFTYTKYGSSFSYGETTAAKRVWSSTTNEEDIAYIVAKELGWKP